MKFAILIDYANTFINIKKIYSIKAIKDIEEEIIRIVMSVTDYLKRDKKVSKKGISVTQVIATVLDDTSFGQPEKNLSQHGIQIRRVDNGVKSDKMKGMNQSRVDDDELMKIGESLIEKGEVDGLLIMSNDTDFISLIQKVRHLGGFVYVGTHEGNHQRASYRLKKMADKVIPIHEVLKNGIDSIPLPPTEELLNELTEEINGPHIAIYQRGKIIMRYPLDRNIIEIGRRSTSRHHLPHIDLTEFDNEKVVSRQHAKVQKIQDRLLFSVHKECTRGTWKDRYIVHPCENFFLEPGMGIILGSPKNGFGLEYRLK